MIQRDNYKSSFEGENLVEKPIIKASRKPFPFSPPPRAVRLDSREREGAKRVQTPQSQRRS